jgi:peptide/nickel transport system substrate-binding protein
MALDRDAYLAALGSGGILNYPAKDGDAAYTPLEELPADIRENFEYNPERARELLTEAGYPNGFTTTILIQSAGWEDSMALVAANWADIGVTATLDLQIQPAYNDVMFGGNYLGTVSVGLGGCSIWCVMGSLGDYREATEEEIADDTLRKFNGNLIASSGYNIGFVDPVFKDLLDRASATLDAVEAGEILKEANLYTLSQVHAVITPTFEVNTYWWPWIKNFYGECGDGYFARTWIYGTAWIDPDLKEEMGH